MSNEEKALTLILSLLGVFILCGMIAQGQKPVVEETFNQRQVDKVSLQIAAEVVKGR